MPAIPSKQDPAIRVALADYRPSEPWHGHPASFKQRQALERRGYGPLGKLTKGQANHLLQKPTPRQLEFLCGRGMETADLSFDEARRLIAEIAADEGWGERLEPEPEYSSELPF